MLKILLADDEEISLKCLIETIDWNSLGFEIIGSARNGLEALELYKEHRPDIVITDISMPYMSGLELAKNIRQISKKTKFIILTAYPVFEYAQQAIDYTVSSYLLKPIKNEDLIDTLLCIKDKMNESQPESDPIPEDNAALPEINTKDLTCFLLNKNEEQTHNLINGYFKKYRKLPSNHLDDAKKHIGQIVSYLQTELIKDASVAREIFGHDLHPFAELDAFSTLNEIQTYLTDIAEQILSSYYFYTFINSSAIVQNAIIYIMNNYAEKISATTAAASQYISSEHLMRSFKKDTGLTFSEYLANYRINTAIRLLKSKKYKVYEVCELVGYKNIIYFNKLFKQITGHSPTYFTKQRN